MTVNYPTELPVESMGVLFDIASNGAFKSRIEEFGLHAWNVQGFGQSVLLGDPNKIDIKSHIETPVDVLAAKGVQIESYEAVEIMGRASGRISSGDDGTATLDRAKWVKVLAYLAKLLPMVLPLILEEE